MRYLKDGELELIKDNYENLDDVSKKLLKTVLFLQRRIENYKMNGYALKQTIKEMIPQIGKIQNDIKMIISDYECVKNSMNELNDIMKKSDLYKDEIELLERYIENGNFIVSNNNIQ